MPNPNKQGTSTQIRNFYSEGYSYMNLKFYNTSLSLSFAPFLNKDQNGRASYDMNNSVLTTISFDGAYSLYQICNEIIADKVKIVNLVIPCNGAALTLKREFNNMVNQYETMIIINKNNKTVAFKFQTIPVQIKDDSGIQQTKMIESGLGAFMKTIEGYLVGINADRHLDKLTDDFANQQNNTNTTNNMNNTHPNNNYQNNNGYRNNNNYNRNNNNRPPYKPKNNWNNGGPSQNFNDYTLQS